MKTLRFILGDQLSLNIASLRDSDKDRDVVLMAEVSGKATYVRHHKKKIAFIFSAMRHFAAKLRERGFQIDYGRLAALRTIAYLVPATHPPASPVERALADRAGFPG